MYSPRLRSPLSRALSSAVALKRCGNATSRLASASVVHTSILSRYSFTPSRALSTQTPLATTTSGISTEEEYHFDEVEINSILKSEEDRLASYNGVQVLNSTGVRAVELCRPDKGNYLTTSVMKNLIKKIDDFEKNWVANAIFLGSQSLYFFSAGVHSSDFLRGEGESEGVELDKTIQVCASRVLDFPDHLISLYGGFITGTSFGMLLGSHYRLGTPSLLLCVDEPTRGQIPLGGLALQFSRHSGSSIAPVVLKYLALSGAPLHSNELYEMGVLTHLTDHKPHRGLQFGDTILKRETQAVQAAHGEPDYLADMIDDMDINADMMDIHSHEAWDQFLTVPVSVPEADAVEDTNLKVIFEDMEGCFAPGVSVEECVRLLVQKREKDMQEGRGQGQQWVQNALSNVVQCSPLALKCWFRLVDEAQRVAVTYQDMTSAGDEDETEGERKQREVESQNFYKRSHADMLALEVSINEVLRKDQRDGKWVDASSSTKDCFKLSFYEDDPVEEIDLLEKKTLKQLTEEEEKAVAARQQIENKLSSDIDSFLTGLAAVSDEQVAAVFAAAVPALNQK